MALWRALFAGEIVPRGRVEEMTRPRSDVPPKRRYGLGFWLHGTSDTVLLVGSDAGVSFYSGSDRHSGRGFAVLSNTSDGAWPAGRLLVEWLG